MGESEQYIFNFKIYWKLTNINVIESWKLFVSSMEFSTFN